MRVTRAGRGISRTIAASTVVAIAMVLAAGAISCFGLHTQSGGEVSRAPLVLAAVALGHPQPTYPLLASEGGLPTRVVVAAAGIDASVSEVGVVLENERAVWQTAWRSVGHHMDSARPGQPGNMVLTGHVSVADRGNLAVFKSLDKVRTGDYIEVQSGDRVYRYVVRRVLVVDSSEVRLLRSENSATVTLITCTTDLKRRLVVVGTLDEGA